MDENELRKLSSVLRNTENLEQVKGIIDDLIYMLINSLQSNDRDFIERK